MIGKNTDTDTDTDTDFKNTEKYQIAIPTYNTDIDRALCYMQAFGLMPYLGTNQNKETHNYHIR